MFLIIAGLIGIQAEAQQLGNQDDGKQIKGEVTDASTGQALSNIEVMIQENGEEAESATTEEDGSFSVEDLEPGTYNVQVRSDGYEQFSQEVEVSEDGESEVQINLQPEGDSQQGPMDDRQSPPTEQENPDRPTDSPDRPDRPTDDTEPSTPSI